MRRWNAVRRIACVAGFFLLLVTAALWLGWSVARRHTVTVKNIPARPVLSSWPVGLSTDIARGEQLAKSYFHPANGLALLSRLYHSNGFYTEAMLCYQGLETLESQEARWPYMRADILGGFGRLEEALPLFQRAAALAPGYVPARMRLGNVLFKSNQTAAAAENFAAVLKRDSGNQYALLGLARCAVVRNEWSRAREYLQAAIESHPDFIGALSLMVTVDDHVGDKAAADSLRAVIGTRQSIDAPDPWLDSLYDDCYDPYRLSVAAAVANQTGNSVTARRWLERAIALAPTNNSYLRELAKMFFQAHDYPLARQYLEKAVTVGPTDSDAWALLVDLLRVMGDTAGSENALVSGLAHCPESAALHYTRGHRLSATGNYNEAVTELKISKKLRPSEPATYVDLAVIYFHWDRADEAVAELKEALLFQPGNPLALEVLARYAIGANDEAAARHWIQQLHLQPRVPDADLKFIAEEYQQRFNHLP